MAQDLLPCLTVTETCSYIELVDTRHGKRAVYEIACFPNSPVMDCTKLGQAVQKLLTEELLK